MDICAREEWDAEEKGMEGSCWEISLRILISMCIKVEVKIILITNCFNQWLLPVQSLQKIKMRGKASAQGSQCDKQSLRSIDKLYFPFSTLIGYISLLFMFPTASFVFLWMNAMLRRQKSVFWMQKSWRHGQTCEPTCTHCEKHMHTCLHTERVHAAV